MAEFVTKIQELPIASDRAKADISGNSIVDTYATKTEGEQVSVSEGATKGYLSDVLKAGTGITLTESDSAITASANIRTLYFGKEITADEWQDLYSKLTNEAISLVCQRSYGLYPLAKISTTEITFAGVDISSDYSSKFRSLVLRSDGTWSEGAWLFCPLSNNSGKIISGAPISGTKILTEKTENYWTGYWIPVLTIPIGRFCLTLKIEDTTAYNTSMVLDLMGIDANWLTASYTCLNPEKDYLRIWKDSTNWFIGFDGTALSKSRHTLTYRISSNKAIAANIISNETRLDPSTLDISGVHLQKPVANTTPDWNQSAPTSDTAELNPDQGSTELS